MVLASSRTGHQPDESREWLQRAQALADQAERIAPGLGVAGAVGRYLAAARAAVEDPEVSEDPGQTLLTAWFLWERGRPIQAARYAARAASKLSSPFANAPQIMGTDEFERRNELFYAARAGLYALVAMEAADRGDLPAVDAAVNAILEARFGVAALTVAEGTTVRACVAIGLQCGGAEEAAGEQLEKAAGNALTLARRGELAPFGRLCQALLELLSPDRAALTWAGWLTAAASVGTSEALRLIAAYVRWIPEDDLTNVVVDAQTGQLRSRP